uniref:Wall-associated receptor kinase galacturonan-binding domain-containing protein n=2 Tax=Aegilops tauschii subsp. strangulata TaxID=200361 RepID=A0A453DUV5_AEGTS
WMFPWLGPRLFLSFVIISTMPTLLLAADCEPKRCGNVSISAPFGVVSGSEENRCAQLGFQVHCSDGVPYLGYYEAEHGLQILDIFYINGSLLVSDVHKLRGFNLSDKNGCHVPKANTAAKIGHPFSISPESEPRLLQLHQGAGGSSRAGGHGVPEQHVCPRGRAL